MFLDINKIGPEGVPLNTDLRLPDLVGAGGNTYPVPDARIEGQAVPGNHGVDLSGRLLARVTMPCSRCIESFAVSIETALDLTLVPEAVEFAHGEAKVEREDTALFYVKGGKVDLAAVAVEQIYLNLPQKPVCSPDCKGLCPACGGNRNEIPCDCRGEAIDPRLAPLLDLKKKH